MKNIDRIKKMSDKKMVDFILLATDPTCRSRDCSKCILYTPCSGSFDNEQIKEWLESNKL